MARAAGTTIECVALQSLHQHSAPILDADAVRLLHDEKSAQLAQHLKFTDDIASRTSAAITESLKQLQPVTKIVGSKAKVDRVAANRRVPQPDGSIAVRASVTREAAVRDAPEGLIDPWLRTLTFSDGDRKLVQLHYYATHPQTFYGDARVSWDSVGIARERMEKSSGVFQIYFTGCGGNVTMGKYNDGNRESRELMATRLLDAMQRSSSADADSIANTVDVASLKPSNIQWDSAPIEFTVREEGTFNPELLKTQLDPDQPFTTRLTAAMFSGFGQRLRDGYIAQATRLRIGNIDVVNLPGEPFVEFQLFAQQVAVKDSFTCVAGYGECGVWYYGPDSIFTDRGGFGDFCHRPDLRSGPGYWEVLGDGSDARPHAQTNVRRGDKGLAMKLTRAADGSANLSVRHHGRNDRSLFPFPGDTAISSGSCDLEFWMIRPDAKSGVVAYLQYDIDSAHRFDVGLYVPAGDNSTIYFRDARENVASKATFPIGVWQRVRIHVDLEQNTYSAEIAAADSTDEVGFAIKDVTTNTLIFELRTRAGTWHYGTSEQLTDTEIPAAFDAWNHLQLTLDSTSGTCEVLTQVIGESPRPLIPATQIGMLPANTPLATELFCNRNAPRNDGPAFDNLRLTRVVKGQD